MASSPIRINEATVDELQILKGIGPKRASYICRYRQEIALIRNTFDLAAATGLSLKAAEQMASEISWETETLRTPTLWPMGLMALASVWLIILGFNELVNEPFVPPAGYYNLALALILLGGFSATGDIAIAAIRHYPGETSWAFKIALLLAASGILILAGLMISSRFISFSDAFNTTLTATTLFIGYCLAIAWQMYAPMLMIRIFIADKSIKQLEKARLFYDASLLMLPLFAIAALVLYNSPGWLEEIFTVWSLVVATIAAREWLKSGTAFVTMLSDEDQGRLRFSYMRHGVT